MPSSSSSSPSYETVASSDVPSSHLQQQEHHQQQQVEESSSSHAPLNHHHQHQEVPEPLPDDETNDSSTSSSDMNRHRLSWMDASMHLIKGNLGPGCLNLPLVFGLAGWGLSTILLVVVAIQGIYSMMLLVECQQCLLLQHSQQHSNVHTFMDVAHIAFGTKGQVVVQLLLFVLQTGVCCVFLSLMVTNMGAQTGISHWWCLVSMTLALLVVVLLRQLKDMRWLSTVANIFMVIAIATAGMAGLQQVMTNPDLEPPSIATTNPSHVANFLASIFFSFEGIGLVLPVANGYTYGLALQGEEEEEEEEEHGYMTAATRYRTRVLPGAMSVVALLFLWIGLAASWGFPHITSGSITAYLDAQYPHNHWYDVVNVLVMVAVFFTFQLQLTPAMEVLEEWLSAVWKTQDEDDDDDHSEQDEAEDERVAMALPNEEPQPPLMPRGVLITTPSPDNQKNDNGDDDNHDDVNDNHRPDALLQDHHQEQDACHFSFPFPLSSWIRQNYGWIVPRWCVVLTCALIVQSVSDLSTLMSLFGAIGTTGLAAMPCACHVVLQRRGVVPKSNSKMVMDIVTILFAGVVMVAGLVVSVHDIYVEEEEQVVEEL